MGNKKNKLKWALIPVGLIIAAEILIALILTVVIVVNVVRTEAILSKNGSGFTSIASAVGNNSETGKGEDLFFEDAVNKCPDCGKALDSLVELVDLGNEYGYDEHGIDRVTEEKYLLMQHNCNADVIYVENYPYMYRRAFGYYTGYWQGAGPQGQGTFIGKARFTDNTVSYTGDWKYGLPEGQGELYIEGFIDSGRSMSYTGQMMAGKRHGQGTMYEYQNGGAYNKNKYFMYDTTMFDNDSISQNTYMEVYDADTQEVIKYAEVVGDGNGYINYMAEWSPGELSPEQKETLDRIVTDICIGFAVYATVQMIQGSSGSNSSYNSSNPGNPNSPEALQAYQAQKEADSEAILAEQKRNHESWRQTQEDNYYKYVNDPSVPAYEINNYYYNSFLY